jgi:hypothetical protein
MKMSKITIHKSKNDEKKKDKQYNGSQNTIQKTKD